MTTPLTTQSASAPISVSDTRLNEAGWSAESGAGAPGALRVDAATARAQAAQTPPIELFRWASIAVGIVLATTKLNARPGVILAAGALLIAYAAFRTLKPIALERKRSATAEIGLEFVFHTAMILITGQWISPFAIVLLPTTVLAGFARGYGFAVQMSLATTLMTSIAYYREAHSEQGRSWDYIVSVSSAWFGLLIIVSLVSSYARRVLEHNARQQSLTLDRLGRLAEANALLFQLNKIAQTLPSSLDMGEVLDSTIARLHDLIEFDAITVLLHDESERTWVPVRERGNPGQANLNPNQLPLVLQSALAQPGALVENQLGVDESGGLWPEAQSGLYTAISARGVQIGLLALESSTASAFANTDIEVLNGIADSFAYAVSNARLFSRLRTIGAEEERTRIARDLHDQIGQALAHLGFELDRAKRANDRGEDMKSRLEELRSEVGGVTRMVRDTLYDLRTDVTESQDVRQTIELFLSRVAERSGLDVGMEVNATGRMPLVQEREMWRIAKEAVVNVERHAKASKLTISWTTDGRTAELIVSDDGVGYDKSRARADSYGIMGMRERAASIGARLELDSSPGSGTTIRVNLANAPQ
jgi:signal transduction histidine kinase